MPAHLTLRRNHRRPYLMEAGSTPGALRVALVVRTPDGQPVHPECERATRDAGKLMIELGHRVEETQLGSCRRVRSGIPGRDRRQHTGRHRTLFAKDRASQPSPEEFEKITWMFFESGAKVSASDYAQAVLAIHRTGRQVARWFDNYDVMLSPTLAELPAKIGVAGYEHGRS